MSDLSGVMSVASGRHRGGRSWSSLWAVLTALAVIWVLVLSPADAQRGGDDEEEDDINRVISERVAEPLQEAIEAVDGELFSQALASLNEALAVRNVTPYELGVLLQFRGNVKFNLDDTRGAIADWERAMAEGELLQKERLALLYNVGMLYLGEEEFGTAVRTIEDWLAQGGEGTTPIHLNMVYAYSELNRLRDSLRHARLAYDRSERPIEKRVYDTLNFLYSELNMPRERLQIISEMAGVYTNDKDVWITLAALYGQLGQERKAFEVYRSMYENGMLTDQRSIVRLVENYSYYEVPFHGARILEQEMNAGRVARTIDHYDDLARFYQQAREFELAVNPLRRAAELAASGERYKDLGQSFYRLGRLEEAEVALNEAIDKGEMDNQGKAYELLAASLYEKPDDEETLDETTVRLEMAQSWYEEAADYYAEKEWATAERKAREWMIFIQGDIDGRVARAAFDADVEFETIRVNCANYDLTVMRTILDQGRSLGELNPRLDGINCIELLDDVPGYRAKWDAERAALASLDVDAGDDAGEVSEG